MNNFKEIKYKFDLTCSKSARKDAKPQKIAPRKNVKNKKFADS